MSNNAVDEKDIITLYLFNGKMRNYSGYAIIEKENGVEKLYKLTQGAYNTYNKIGPYDVKSHIFYTLSLYSGEITVDKGIGMPLTYKYIKGRYNSDGDKMKGGKKSKSYKKKNQKRKIRKTYKKSKK